MLAFVRDGTAQEHNSNQTREPLEALSCQLELANRAASRFRVSLPHRDEAITELSRQGDAAASEARLYVGIFAADVLSALRLRHGNEVSEHLLDEMSRKGIVPLSPGAKIFRWSAQSILAVWHSTKKLEQFSADIAHACQTPFDCRVFVGTRVATFRIPMRFAVLDAQTDAAELIRVLDEFAAGTETR